MARLRDCHYVFSMGAIGKYDDHTSGRTAGLTVARALAGFALLLHIALPTVLQMAGPATQALFETVICTGGENRTIYLDADGNPVEPVPAGTSHDSGSCLHHCGAMLASTFAHAASGWAPPMIAVPVAYLVAAIVPMSAQPRAPPAASGDAHR